MRPFAPTNGHDVPWLIDELVPCLAAMVDDVVVGGEDAVGEPDRIMIDATHLKAHRTAASLLKGGLFPDVSGAPRAA